MTMLIDLTKLAQDLSNHVGTCASAPFLCSEWASFESWFRVELVVALTRQGYDLSAISTAFNYPGTWKKADLTVSTVEGRIVMELKSFVSNQDAQKKGAYPEQIDRLLNLLQEEGSIAQVITFTTFQGYSAKRICNLMDRLFTDSRWSMVGPMPVVPSSPSFQFLVTGAVRE